MRCTCVNTARSPWPCTGPCWRVRKGSVLGLVRIDDLDGSLDVFGERLLGGESSWQYAFRIEHAGNEIASGRAAVMLNPGSS